MTQKELIEGLIDIILTTEEEESVSSSMVGRILNYLNTMAKSNATDMEEFIGKVNTPVMQYLIKPLMKDSESGGLRLRYSKKNLSTGTTDNSIDNSVIIPVVTSTTPGLMSPEMLTFSITVSEQWNTLTLNVSQLSADMYEGGGTVPTLQADVDNLISDMYEAGCIVPQLQEEVSSLNTTVSNLYADMYEGGGTVQQIQTDFTSLNTTVTNIYEDLYTPDTGMFQMVVDLTRQGKFLYKEMTDEEGRVPQLQNEVTRLKKSIEEFPGIGSLEGIEELSSEEAYKMVEEIWHDKMSDIMEGSQCGPEGSSCQCSCNGHGSSGSFTEDDIATDQEVMDSILDSIESLLT